MKDDDLLARDDPVTPLIAKLHAMVDGSEPIVTEASVEAQDHTPFWQHTLVRRTFAFAAIKGKLDGFDLRCKHDRIVSPVSDTAQWTVPKSWSECTVYVTGTEGTTFQFVELKP